MFLAQWMAGGLLLGSCHAAEATGPSLQDQQQAACYDDVMRLCADDVPDVDKVKACMRGRKRQVSPACAAFYPRGR
jgi:hypothetical protein